MLFDNNQQGKQRSLARFHINNSKKKRKGKSTKIRKSVLVVMVVETCRFLPPSKVARRVYSATRVVVLIEVLLERIRRVLFPHQAITRSGKDVVLVFHCLFLLAAVHAPQDEGNGTHQDGTSNASHNASDDFLAAGTKSGTSAAGATAVLHNGRYRCRRIARGR